jgi:hypothetical protein
LPDYILYHMPGSCSRVAAQCAGDDWPTVSQNRHCTDAGRTTGISLSGHQPQGQGPGAGDRRGASSLSCPAIAYHLANAHPEAGLLPVGEDGDVDLKALSNLIWLAGTLQTLVTRLFRPAASHRYHAVGNACGCHCRRSVAPHVVVGGGCTETTTYGIAGWPLPALGAPMVFYPGRSPRFAH